MKIKNIAFIILAAGYGTRMKSNTPKALHKLAGFPMINWVVDACSDLSPTKIIVVGPDNNVAMADAVVPHQCVIQSEPKGTADAARIGLEALAGFDGDVVIMLGDMPLITTQTIENLVMARSENEISVLCADFVAPIPPYGRVSCETNGIVREIIEDKDCNEAQKAISMCNLGGFCASAGIFRDILPKISNENAQNEYYLTDLVHLAAEKGIKTKAYVLKDNAEARGVNMRTELASLEVAVQDRLRAQMMDNGVSLLNPASVYFSKDTQIGPDSLIEPDVFFGPNVTIGAHAHIKAFSHIEGLKAANNVTVGPFARIRPETVLSDDVRVGNFVEIKKSSLGKGTKAGHLAYIGDAVLGANVNYSAGVVTANYDGFKKHKTIIEDNVMVGTNTTIIPPLTIHKGAFVAGGSIVTSDVASDALYITRAESGVSQGWAGRHRDKNGQK